jgi:hypothetical protein
MTSPLRRKHPITAPNTRPKKGSSPARLGLAALTTYALLAAVSLHRAAAADNEPLLFPPTNNANDLWKARDDAGSSHAARARTGANSGSSQFSGSQSHGAAGEAAGGLKWKPRWPSVSTPRQVAELREQARPSSMLTAGELPIDQPQNSVQPQSSVVRRPAQLQSIDPLHDPFGDRAGSVQASDERYAQQDGGGAPLRLEPAQSAGSSEDVPAGPMLPVASGDPPMPMPVMPIRDLAQPQPLQRGAGGPQQLPRPFDDTYCKDPQSCIVQQKTLKQLGNAFLDITPDLEPNTDDPDHTRRMDYMSATQPRPWNDRDGRPLGQGRFVDFQHGRVIIEPVDGGSALRVPFDDLGDDELCYVTSWWRLPQECTLGHERFAGRNWVPMTWSWKASALCHKPLYFEEEALERYGHMAGPLAQPALSGAHFFLNIAVLPYKMGINPPNECQYALGYYRPGSCAPWILDPIPLSLRGALYQTTAVAAGITGIP